MSDHLKIKSHANTLGWLAIICLAAAPLIGLVAFSRWDMKDASWHLWAACASSLIPTSLLLFFFSQLLHIRAALEKRA